MMEHSDTVAEKEGRAGIRWLRIIVAGLAAEVALMIVAVPALLLPNPQLVLNIAIPPLSFVALVLFGYWAARPALRLQPLHGLLTGAVGIALYVGLMLAASSVPGAPENAFAASLTPAYLLAHALKLIGGWVGGTLAARKARPDVAPRPSDG